MKIRMKTHDSRYVCCLDTEVMDVLITEAFTVAGFETEDEERLDLCMRDSGFEIRYYKDGIRSFDIGLVTLNNGGLNHQPLQTETSPRTGWGN